MEKFVGANVLSAAVLVVGITLLSPSANQKAHQLTPNLIRIGVLHLEHILSAYCYGVGRMSY